MARCLPFRSTSYVNDEPSIKLKAEPAKKRKEEKKRDEKRHEKQKRHTKESGDVENKKHQHKRRREEERSKKDKVRSGHEKKRKTEVSCLEDSSLTEERGQPAESYNSTDSTGKQHISKGFVLRIKLPTQCLKDSEVLPADPLGRTKLDDVSVQLMDSEPCSTSGNMGPEPTIWLSKSKPTPQILNHTDFLEPQSNCLPEFTSANMRPSKSKTSPFVTVPEIPNLKDRAKPPSSLRPSSPPAFDLDYRDLLQSPLELEDSDSWLFGTKKDQNGESIKNKGSVATELNVVRSSGGFPVPYPRAQYLAEAGIYALPYVLPY